VEDSHEGIESPIHTQFVETIQILKPASFREVHSKGDSAPVQLMRRPHANAEQVQS
jgi:hypothetical protein